MDPEDGITVPLESLGGGFVGQEHTLLDKAMRRGAGLDGGLFEFVFGVDGQFDLVGAEIEALFEPLFAQTDGDLLQRQKPVEDFLLRFAEVGAPPLQDRIDLVVVPAPFGVDDALEELFIDGLESFGIEGDLADKGEAVHMGFEGADVLTQLSGEHGKGLVGQVGGETPQLRLLVDGAEVGDVVAHIGDGDIEDMTLQVQIDGVVEILGGDGIDGAKGEMPQIDPPPGLLGEDPVGDGQGLFHAVGWELVIPALVEQQADPFIHFRIPQMSQYLDHLGAEGIDEKYRTQLEGFEIHPGHFGLDGLGGLDVQNGKLPVLLPVRVADEVQGRRPGDQDHFGGGTPPTGDDPLDHHLVAVFGIVQVLGLDEKILLIPILGLHIPLATLGDP